jgi:curved DNA-binding protein CbpA
MTDAEARSVLGVAPDATRAEINAAWKRLMARAHPDQGGTQGLAARLNAARDHLLKR